MHYAFEKLVLFLIYNNQQENYTVIENSFVAIVCTHVLVLGLMPFLGNCQAYLTSF